MNHALALFAYLQILIVVSIHWQMSQFLDLWNVQWLARHSLDVLNPFHVSAAHSTIFSELPDHLPYTCKGVCL